MTVTINIIYEKIKRIVSLNKKPRWIVVSDNRYRDIQGLKEFTPAGHTAIPGQSDTLLGIPLAITQRPNTLEVL